MNSVVVICLDSVRKDYFDEHADRLRALSDGSFGECRVASTWSLPSHASMLTGDLPSTHGVHTHNLDYSTLDAETVLTRRLDAHRSICVSANEFTTEAFGFDEWFDDLVTVDRTHRFPTGLDARHSEGVLDHVRRSLRHDHPLSSLANGAADALASATDGRPVPSILDDGASAIVRESLRRVRETAEPFFLFTNFMDAHLPHRNLLAYDADVPYRWTSEDLDRHEMNKGGADAMDAHREDVERFRALYAAGVRYLDRVVAEFVADVRAAAEGDVTFVVTADHGENLAFEADDWLLGHNSSVSEGLLHVPLEVIGADADPGDGFVSHLDLPDLVAGLAEGEVPDLRRERAPAEVLGGGPIGTDVGAYWNRGIRAVCDAETATKWVWDSLGGVARYDLGAACEQVPADGESEVPAWARSLFDEELESYRRRVGDDADDHELDAATEERLADLGYL